MSDADARSWGEDQPQGEGWWMASDGKWYPPETAPAAAQPGATGPWGHGVAASAGARPVGGPGQLTLGLDAPLEVTRWRPLVAWFLAIPHFVVLWFYSLLAAFYVVAAVFQVLTRGQVSAGVHTFLVRVGRYAWRVSSYMYFMRDDYPKPFGPTGDDLDPGDDPAWVSLPPAGPVDRWAVLYKWILAIPHILVLYVLGIAAAFCYLVGAFQVLFTGAWNPSLRNFVVAVQRQSALVYAYLLLTDERPPIVPPL